MLYSIPTKGYMHEHIVCIQRERFKDLGAHAYYVWVTFPTYYIILSRNIVSQKQFFRGLKSKNHSWDVVACRDYYCPVLMCYAMMYSSVVASLYFKALFMWTTIQGQLDFEGVRNFSNDSFIYTYMYIIQCVCRYVYCWNDPYWLMRACEHMQYN